MIGKQNGRRLKVHSSLIIFALIMIYNSSSALKLEINQQRIHNHKHIEPDALLNLEPRSADEFNSFGNRWFSDQQKEKKGIEVKKQPKSTNGNIENWFKDEFEAKLTEPYQSKSKPKQEKSKLKLNETSNSTLVAPIQENKTEVAASKNQSLSKVESSRNNENQDLSIKQIKQRIKRLESKLERKQGLKEETNEQVYHERPMSDSEKQNMKYVKNDNQGRWDQDQSNIDEIDKKIAKMKQRLTIVSHKIDSAYSFESQESLQATAEKEAAETAVRNALEFYNQKSLDVVKALDQANQQIDKQDVYSIKQIDQIAGGDKYDHERGHAENERAMQAKQMVIDKEKERDDAAERLRVTTQLALEKHDYAISEEERLRQEKMMEHWKNKRSRLQIELDNLLEERKIAELEARINKKKRKNEEDERRLRRQEQESKEWYYDQQNRIFKTFFEFVKRETFDLFQMSDHKDRESFKHSQLSAFNTQELEEQLSNRQSDYILVKNNKIVFSNCYKHEYDYQRLVGFAILQNYLIPKDQQAADSHVMVWVQNNGRATDIYWKSELEMNQQDFDILYQNLVNKGFGPVSLRMESGILQVAQHVTNKRIARQALAVGYYVNAVLGLYNTIPNLSDPASFGISEIRNRRY